VAEIADQITDQIRNGLGRFRRLGLLIALLGPLAAPAGLAQALGGSNAASSGSGAEASAMGSASNSQLNSSESRSYGGNNNSYQYNTEFGRASEYGFSSRQVRCEGPRAFVGGWADPQADYWYGGQLQGNNSWEMRGGAGVVVPFGSLNQTCQAMSRLLEQQLRFDTAVGVVKACQGLRRSGVEFNPSLLAAFPPLAACQAMAALPAAGSVLPGAGPTP